MAVEEVELVDESQRRYLTYALSVVSSRALPDVRDGLKPVQRRILYAMAENLGLVPEKPHRKSAAVVGEVLARYHPHGDAACYEALVRMAQDFSLRYPLVDGQGNFGSLDGDAAAAYRYTEARLRPIALEVLGDIGQETVAERENFDQTTTEPVVLPSRVPNLLINGCSGIAVGMATAIPPHNLKEIVAGLLMVIEDERVSTARLLRAIKGPDFPTGCLILNTQAEIEDIYTTGRGAIRMRAAYKLEDAKRGKQSLIITEIPYGLDKSALVEKIADLIVSRSVPQLTDIRDESTNEVRIVLELAPDADGDKAMTYLFKHTPLQQNFNVNLTALVPSVNPCSCRPMQLSLRDMLVHFVSFRLEVTRRKLLFEKGKLDERLHLLAGLERVFDVLDEVIAIVRKSSGRADAAARLCKRFKLDEQQALFIVDLRIYQLSRTSIEEIRTEMQAKSARVRDIERILASDKELRKEVSSDLERIARDYGDARRSPVVSEFEEPEYRKEEFVEHGEVFVVVTRDGWLKRISATSDVSSTRIREGDSLFFAERASTREQLALVTNMGNLFVTAVYDLVQTSGFGEPVQKMFRFQDNEQIVSCFLSGESCASGGEEGQMSLFDEKKGEELLLFSRLGYGFRLKRMILAPTKKSGKRLMKLGDGDELFGVSVVDRKMLMMVSEQGYVLCFLMSDVPLLQGSAKGVILQRYSSGDRLTGAIPVDRKDRVKLRLKKGTVQEVAVSALTIGSRAKRGEKAIKRGGPVVECSRYEQGK